MRSEYQEVIEMILGEENCDFNEVHYGWTHGFFWPKDMISVKRDLDALAESNIISGFVDLSGIEKAQIIQIIDAFRPTGFELIVQALWYIYLGGSEVNRDVPIFLNNVMLERFGLTYGPNPLLTAKVFVSSQNEDETFAYFKTEHLFQHVIFERNDIRSYRTSAPVALETLINCEGFLSQTVGGDEWAE